MIGSIAGDIIGSVYERHGITTKKFPLFGKFAHFTDDTVLTVATAHCLLTGTGYSEAYRSFGLAHPDRGYGGDFRKWVFNPQRGPSNSFGNGSAMRVGPVGFACGSIEDVLVGAQRSAEVTHNHPEGVKGAQAVALAVFLSRTGACKADIEREIIERFDYRLNRGLEDIREEYGFDVTCQASAPKAIIAFIESGRVEYPSATLSRSAVTPTPRPAWPVGSPKPSTRVDVGHRSRGPLDAARGLPRDHQDLLHALHQKAALTPLPPGSRPPQRRAAFT